VECLERREGRSGYSVLQIGEALAGVVLDFAGVNIVEESIYGEVSPAGVFERGSRALPSDTAGEKQPLRLRTTSGIRVSAYVSLRNPTKSHSRPRILVVPVSKCLLCSGFTATLPTEPVVIPLVLRYPTKSTAKVWPDGIDSAMSRSLDGSDSICELQR